VAAVRAGPNNSSSSSRAAGKASIGGGRWCSGSSSWGLSSIGVDAAGLPASTERVLLCLISSGVHKDAPGLAHNRWSGCVAEDPLDPTGCALPWASSPSSAGFRPRGTWAASIIAAKEGGLIPAGTDIHVVPVDGPALGSLDPGSTAPHGKSRLRAYSVCEGRLRGLQAQEFPGSASGKRWRMVMLVDVVSDAPASTGSGEFSLSEAEWIAAATGPGTAEAVHTPDVLVVAPAGQKEGVGFPAALPHVIGVGSHKCSGEAMQSYANSGKPDILAPGANIAVGADAQPWTDSAAAAAFVAGAAVRLWSGFPRCSANEVRGALLAAASKEAPLSAVQLSLPTAVAALRKLSCAA
jgi:hypothetical protein